MAKFSYLHFLHGNFILDGACKTTMGKLTVQVNNALRAIHKVNCHYPTVKLYSDVNVDTRATK